MIASKKEVGVFLLGRAHHFHEKLRELALHDHGVRWLGVSFDYLDGEQRVRAMQPDVLLLVPQLPGAVEYELVKRLRIEPHPPSLIMGCPVPTDESLLLALSLGVAACVAIDMPPASLLRTIRRVGNGQAPTDYDVLSRIELAPQVKERLQAMPPPPVRAPSPNPLSRRERELLKVVSQGHSNREVGRLLDIQEQTVKNHMSAILRKMHARDRFQAAAKALRNGCIPLT